MRLETMNCLIVLRGFFTGGYWQIQYNGKNYSCESIVQDNIQGLDDVIIDKKNKLSFEIFSLL